MPNPNDQRPNREPMTDEPGRPSRTPEQDPNEEESQYGGTERQAPGYGEPDSGTEDDSTRRRKDRVEE